MDPFHSPSSAPFFFHSGPISPINQCMMNSSIQTRHISRLSSFLKHISNNFSMIGISLTFSNMSSRMFLSLHSMRGKICCHLVNCSVYPFFGWLFVFRWATVMWRWSFWMKSVHQWMWKRSERCIDIFWNRMWRWLVLVIVKHSENIINYSLICRKTEDTVLKSSGILLRSLQHKSSISELNFVYLFFSIK